MSSGENQSSNSGGVVATTYIREMLELNPMWQAPQIIRRRHELWRGYEAPVLAPNASLPVDTTADQRLRNRARQCLESLQTNFYQLPETKLWQFIGALESDRLPEYAATAARLRAVANVRGELIDTLRETTDAKFAYSLQRALVSPPAESGTLREQYIESLISERRIAKAIEMVRRYVSVHPQIYELERDWFDTLLDPANQREWKARYSYGARTREFVGRGSGGVWGSMGFLVVLAIIRGAMAIPRTVDSSGNSRPQPAVTQPYTPPPSYPPMPSSITGTMDTPTQVAPALSFNTNDSNEYHRKVKEHFEALNRQAQLEIESQMQERNRWKQQQQELSEAHQQQLEEIHNLLHSTRSPIFAPPTLPRSMPFPQPPSVPRPGEGGFQ
jgi:hypothetical protein